MPLSFPLRLLALLLLLNLCIQATQANDRTLLYPRPDPASSDQVNWIEEIEQRIPPLKNDRKGRWPLVLWHTIQPEQITHQTAAMLLARGLVPSLPMVESSIRAAQVLQGTGAPVILTAGSGAGSPWPYNLQQDRNKWAYRFDNPNIPEHWRDEPVPTLFSGWSIAAQQIKNILNTFKDAGIQVDAAWLDYENLPVLASHDVATRSANGRELLPGASLANANSFARYTRQLWVTLLSTYIAAPIREIYPAASVTNWIAVLSLPEFPALSWRNTPLPLVGPTLFTATNPIAYGIDTAFNEIAKLNAMTTQRDVDRIYTKILLRQVSADSYARARVAPELDSVAWIARWVRDAPRRSTPMMSRAAYREALRHLWLRGVDAMEIFSPVRQGFSELAIQEIKDAVSVFDEMLGYAEVLQAGEVMNYEYKPANMSSVFWSGLRHEKLALVRVLSFSEKNVTIQVEPWANTFVKILALPAGATYRLSYDRLNQIVTVH